MSDVLRPFSDSEEVEEQFRNGALIEATWERAAPASRSARAVSHP